MNDTSALLLFSIFELDLDKQELRKKGALVKLQAQPFKVLALLADRPGELIDRDEIRRHLWGAGTFVDFDQGINVCIRQIRQALGDHATSPRFVETVPRKGYRFLAPVQRPQQTIAQVPTRRPRPRRRLAAAVLVVAASALTVGALVVGRHRSPELPVTTAPVMKPTSPSKRAADRLAAGILVVLPFQSYSTSPDDGDIAGS